VPDDVRTIESDATGVMLSTELVVVGDAVVVGRDVEDEVAERENVGVPVSVACKLPDAVDDRDNVIEVNEVPDTFEVTDIVVEVTGEALLLALAVCRTVAGRVNIALEDTESVPSGLGLAVPDANALELVRNDTLDDGVPAKVKDGRTDEDPVRETGEALDTPLGDAGDDGDSTLLRVNVCELRYEASEEEEREYVGGAVADCRDVVVCVAELDGLGERVANCVVEELPVGASTDFEGTTEADCESKLLTDASEDNVRDVEGDGDGENDTDAQDEAPPVRDVDAVGKLLTTAVTDIVCDDFDEKFAEAVAADAVTDALEINEADED